MVDSPPNFNEAVNVPRVAKPISKPSSDEVNDSSDDFGYLLQGDVQSSNSGKGKPLNEKLFVKWLSIPLLYSFVVLVVGLGGIFGHRLVSVPLWGVCLGLGVLWSCGVTWGFWGAVKWQSKLCLSALTVLCFTPFLWLSWFLFLN